MAVAFVGPEHGNAADDDVRSAEAEFLAQRRMRDARGQDDWRVDRLDPLRRYASGDELLADILTDRGDAMR